MCQATNALMLPTSYSCRICCMLHVAFFQRLLNKHCTYKSIFCTHSCALPKSKAFAEKMEGEKTIRKKPTSRGTRCLLLKRQTHRKHLKMISFWALPKSSSSSSASAFVFIGSTSLPHKTHQIIMAAKSDALGCCMQSAAAFKCAAAAV